MIFLNILALSSLPKTFFLKKFKSFQPISNLLGYVKANGHPVERFLGFLELASHTGKDMAQQVVSFLVDECGLDFKKCRGQSYDNAANMSGEYYYF